jgi:anti-anti-sigma factor
MLNATAQKLGDSTVLRCQGRIVIGDAYAILRNAVLGQTHTRTLILDLAQVDRIDAGALGVLLGLREWAYSHAIRFQLMNVMNQVERVLELTRLDCVFEFCSVEHVLQLHFEAAIAPRSVGQANQRIMKDNCKYSVEGQDAAPAAERINLPAGTAAREQEWAGVPADVQSAQTGVGIRNEGSVPRQEYDSYCWDARRH